MKLKGKKRYIVLAFLLIAVPLGLMVGRDFFYQQLKKRLEAQLHRLRDAGYVVTYESISVDWEKKFVEVRDLKIKHNIDSNLCHTTDFIAAKQVKAKGIRIMTFLMKGHLSFESIFVDSSKFIFHEKILKKDSTKRNQKEFTIIVDNLEFPNLSFEYYNSRDCKTESTFTGSTIVKDFNLGLYADRPLFIDVESLISKHIEVNLPEEFYAIKVRQITFKPPLKLLDIDTVRVEPYFSKLAFARKKGFETDRIEAIIPYINFYGFSVFRNDSLSFRADKITTQLFMYVFRDKRLPFKKFRKQLPMEALNASGVGIDVETIVLNKSFIQYEEFPEEGDSSGRVYFDDLYATITNVNNLDKSRKGITKLVAESRFLGNGKIKVRGHIPWNTKLKHRVNGVIEDLDMKKLNPMLEPAVQVSVESGHMNNLNFSFAGSSSHSNGEIEMNYNDLKLMAFKSEKRIDRILKRKKPKNEDDEEKMRKASVKSFILNTFVIGKDMKKNLPEDKRTGTIDFDRDMNKSVFNFWWKSVLSGIKSAYNIDRIEDSKIVNALKKKDKGAP